MFGSRELILFLLKSATLKSFPTMGHIFYCYKSFKCYTWIKCVTNLRAFADATLMSGKKLLTTHMTYLLYYSPSHSYTVVPATAWKVSLFRVFLVCIFSHSDWIRGDTKYLSVFSPNAEKYGTEKLRIRTLHAVSHSYTIAQVTLILLC